MLLQAFVMVGIDHCVIFMVASWSMIGNVPDGDDIEDGRKKRKGTWLEPVLSLF